MSPAHKLLQAMRDENHSAVTATAREGTEKKEENKETQQDLKSGAGSNPNITKFICFMYITEVVISVILYYFKDYQAYLLILNGFIELVNCMDWGMV